MTNLIPDNMTERETAMLAHAAATGQFFIPKRIVSLDVQLEGGGAGGSAGQPTTSGLDTFSAMMCAPVEAPVSRSALERLMTTYTSPSNMSLEELQKAHRAMMIEHNNSKIDQKKAERKKLRAVAKQARVPINVLKKVLAGAKRGAP